MHSLRVLVGVLYSPQELFLHPEFLYRENGHIREVAQVFYVYFLVFLEKRTVCHKETDSCGRTRL